MWLGQTFSIMVMTGIISGTTTRQARPAINTTLYSNRDWLLKLMKYFMPPDAEKATDLEAIDAVNFNS